MESGGRGGRWGTWVSPALAQACDTAVVLIAPALVEHAGVHDVAHRHVQVVGEEVLKDFQGLVPGGLPG